ncbi:MAG: hypothetical protein EOP16_03500 [Pseudonocardia sp.]|nr:MAG: hypothetical protein EOP16_03500 [Pseudonocardia sp.]
MGGTSGRRTLIGTPRKSTHDRRDEDRVISTVGVATRHTRKSKSHRRDGFRGHLAAEPETGLITDAEMTQASGEAGSDPVVGEQMIARDRYRRADTDSDSARPGPVGDSERSGPRSTGPAPAEDTVPAAPARGRRQVGEPQSRSPFLAGRPRRPVRGGAGA